MQMQYGGETTPPHGTGRGAVELTGMKTDILRKHATSRKVLDFRSMLSYLVKPMLNTE